MQPDGSPTRQTPLDLADQCRATTLNLWPRQRCVDVTGHGRIHLSADGVYWIGPEPPADEDGAA